MNEVLEELTAIVGHALRVERHGKALGDVSRTGGATDRIRDTLGWAPRVSLAEGLRAEYAFFARELAGGSTGEPVGR